MELEIGRSPVQGQVWMFCGSSHIPNDVLLAELTLARMPVSSNTMFLSNAVRNGWTSSTPARNTMTDRLSLAEHPFRIQPSHSSCRFTQTTGRLDTFGASFELVWHRTEEQPVIFLQNTVLETHGEHTLRELAAEGNERKEPFISESDALYVWWSGILSALTPTLHRTILLMTVFDTKPTLVNDILTSNCAFIANTTFVASICRFSK